MNFKNDKKNYQNVKIKIKQKIFKLKILIKLYLNDTKITLTDTKGFVVALFIHIGIKTPLTTQNSLKQRRGAPKCLHLAC